MFLALYVVPNPSIWFQWSLFSINCLVQSLSGLSQRLSHHFYADLKLSFVLIQKLSQIPIRQSCPCDDSFSFSCGDTIQRIDDLVPHLKSHSFSIATSINDSWDFVLFLLASDFSLKLINSYLDGLSQVIPLNFFNGFGESIEQERSCRLWNQFKVFFSLLPVRWDLNGASLDYFFLVVVNQSTYHILTDLFAENHQFFSGLFSKF